MLEFKGVTLDQIGGGVVPELFEHELARILENIGDPNTIAKKPRKLVFEIVFSPTEDRESCSVKVSARSTVVGVQPVSCSLFLGRENGRMVACVRDRKQGELALAPVIPIEGGVR